MARKKKHIEEEHENHERWMVSYADMVTLLMVLFIVMFAMSTVDQKKFNALKAGLAAGFGQSTSLLDGSSAILEQPGMAAAGPVNPNLASDQLSPEVRKHVSEALAKNEHLRKDSQQAEARAEYKRLSDVVKRLQEALVAHDLQDDVQTKIDQRGLVLSLVSKHVVFQADQATLTPRGLAVLDVLAPVLRDLPDPLAISGHTNQAAGKPKYFASDWDLSSARAVTVLRHFNEVEQIPATRLSAQAFGHTMPLIAPDKPGSQAVNKRVDIVVTTSLDSETRALLAQLSENKWRPLPAAATAAPSIASSAGAGEPS